MPPRNAVGPPGSPVRTGREDKRPATGTTTTSSNITGLEPALAPDMLLQLSAERDWWLRRVLAAEVRGYDRGREAGYAQGRADEAAVREEDWAAIARPVARGGLTHDELESRRWKLRGEKRARATFGEPHHDDQAARPAQAPGRVWLGGPPVHYRHDCTPACRAIDPRRPYGLAEAADVLAALPGDYADEIDRLRRDGGG